MQRSKNIWVLLGILVALVVLLPILLLFKFRSFVGPFISPSEGRVNVLILGKGEFGFSPP
jgi:hypothetical protein